MNLLPATATRRNDIVQYPFASVIIYHVISSCFPFRFLLRERERMDIATTTGVFVAKVRADFCSCCLSCRVPILTFPTFFYLTEFHRQRQN